MDFVYIVENERSASGAWSTPEKAVRATCNVDDNDMVEVWDLDREDMRGDGTIKVTIAEAIKRMTVPHGNYPILTKVPIDAEEPWFRDS